jgi:hypothetical protein
MSKTVANDHPREPASRPRSRKPANVSASALAQHLDCSRTYIGKLEAEGVIQRQGDGFPLDQSRVAYLRYLRRERKQSPKGEADSAFAMAKAELIQLRIQERKGLLISAEGAAHKMETILGVFLTALSTFGARVAGRDLAARRIIDQEVFNSRTEVSKTFSRLADADGEPPDNTQDKS